MQPGWPIPPTLENPLNEVERRFADQSPAWLIPRLAAIQNTRQLWAESAKKREHDHRLQFRTMGAEDILEKDGEVEMPGDINIQGDTYHVAQLPPTSTATPATTTSPTPTTTTTNTTTVTKSPIWPALLIGAAMLVGGSGFGLAVSNWIHHDAPSVTQPQFNESDWGLGLEVKNHGE